MNENKPPEITFIEWMQVRGLAPRTIEAYDGLIRNYILVHGEPEQSNITRFLLDHNHNVARAALRSWLKYKGVVNIIIESLRGRQKERGLRYLTHEEVESLAKAAFDKGDIALGIAMRLMFEGGLRAIEVTNLETKNIDLTKRTAKGIGKGNKEFEQPFGATTGEILKMYMVEHPEQERLFLFNRQWLWRKVRELGREILQKEIWPHMFRHACGSYMKRLGYDLKDIQLYLRHSKLETTGIYVHADKEALFAKMGEVMG